jgi:hypothetical protein
MSEPRPVTLDEILAIYKRYPDVLQEVFEDRDGAINRGGERGQIEDSFISQLGEMPDQRKIEVMRKIIDSMKPTHTTGEAIGADQRRDRNNQNGAQDSPPHGAVSPVLAAPGDKPARRKKDKQTH